MTREDWLDKAVERLRPKFDKENLKLPEQIKVSIGFPHKGGTSKRRTLGQCWKPEAATDSIVQIYINPTIDTVSEEQGILSVLVHELIHATGIFNHGAAFGKAAKALGLEGKNTSTSAGVELMVFFDDLIEELGTFPHGTLVPMSAGMKKDTTRMLKVSCECGYTFRITKKWAECGLPQCPLCSERMKLE